MIKGQKQNLKRNSDSKPFDIKMSDKEKSDTSIASINSVETNLLDPLRKFMKKKEPIRIKTLTDIQNQSNSIFEAKKLIQETLIYTQQKKNLEQQSTIRPRKVSCETKKIFSQLIQENVKKKQLQQENDNSGRKRQSSELEKGLKKFKRIDVSIQNFIQLKTQNIEKYYKFKEKIGQGSYGNVYRAICYKSGEQRAIKILKSKIMKKQQKMQLLSEINLLSKLDHPSIIKLYDLFYNSNTYFVVTQYCKGGALTDIIKKYKSISEGFIKNILQQLFSALSYLHVQNIIHRDIKLENLVFVEKQEKNLRGVSIKIIDFGTAVQTKYKVTQNYQLAGTISYMAPQVFKGTLISKSDLWSSGVLMNIILCGFSPFKGGSQAKTREKIIKQPINVETKDYSHLSKDAKNLLKSLLQPNLKKRISAQDALKHPYIKSNDEREINPSVLENISNYSRGNNFISMIQAFVCIRQINQNQRQIIIEIFNQFDKDKNGFIEKQQLQEIFEKHITSSSLDSHTEVENILNMIDNNSSGKIDFNEFLIATTTRQKLFNAQYLNSAFQFFDKDGTGYIEKSQFKNIVKGCDKQELEILLNQLDKDKDSKISKEEFTEYLLNYEKNQNSIN